MKELIYSGHLFLAFGIGIAVVAFVIIFIEKKTTVKDGLWMNVPLLISAGCLWLYTGGRVHDGALLVIAVITQLVFYQRFGKYAMDRFRERQAQRR